MYAFLFLLVYSVLNNSSSITRTLILHSKMDYKNMQHSDSEFEFQKLSHVTKITKNKLHNNNNK